MRGPRITVLAIAGFLFASNALGDYPPAVNMSERQPPTAEDWLRLKWRQQTRCQHCQPMVLPREIVYFPCPPEKHCDEPVHVSYKGCYGMEHPMPYYIPNTRIIVLKSKHGRCPHCARLSDWRFRETLPETAVARQKEDETIQAKVKPAGKLSSNERLQR